MYSWKMSLRARTYVLFEREAREFQSIHTFMFHVYVTRISLFHTSRNTLENQRSNTNSIMTKTPTRTSRSNTGTGPDCASVDSRFCKDNCNERGVCSLGKCVCEPGYEGESCETITPCPTSGPDNLPCGGKNGVCDLGRCFCGTYFLIGFHTHISSINYKFNLHI